MTYRVILLKFIDIDSDTGRTEHKKIYQFRTLVTMYVKYHSCTHCYVTDD